MVFWRERPRERTFGKPSTSLPNCVRTCAAIRDGRSGAALARRTARRSSELSERTTYEPVPGKNAAFAH